MLKILLAAGIAVTLSAATAQAGGGWFPNGTSEQGIDVDGTDAIELIGIALPEGRTAPAW